MPWRCRACAWRSSKKSEHEQSPDAQAAPIGSRELKACIHVVPMPTMAQRRIDEQADTNLQTKCHARTPNGCCVTHRTSPPSGTGSRLNSMKATLALAPDAARRALEALAASREFPQAGDAGMSLINLDRGIFKPTWLDIGGPDFARTPSGLRSAAWSPPCNNAGAPQPRPSARRGGSAA